MRKLVVTLLLTLMALPASAFFSLMDTGELKREGEYRILGEGQILMDKPEGFNLNSRFSTGITDDSEMQFEAGVGVIDYYIGAFWKWVPVPDTADQPAVGARMGFTFADLNNSSTYGLNVTPMISKIFETNFGNLTPFGGIQLGLQKNVNTSFFSMQVALGVEWAPNEWDHPGLKDFNFLLEYGVEVDDSFDYLSFGASYDF